jgi:hypothetical protein
MEPGSYIGDSAPIVMDSSGGLQTLGAAERAKAESPILADFRDSAIKNGYDPLLAEAMVSYGKIVRWVEYAGDGDREGVHRGDRRFVDDTEFAKLTKDGWQEVREAGVPSPIDSADTLLTVSADVAKKIGLSKATVSSPQAFAAEREYTIVGELAPGAGEKFVELLDSTIVRIVLLIVFLMSIYIAMHSPGAPVMRPVTSAAKPAEPSWAVSTNSTPPLRIASISGSTLPLGIPKPRVMPLALSVATIRSALFMQAQPSYVCAARRWDYRVFRPDAVVRRTGALGSLRRL